MEQIIILLLLFALPGLIRRFAKSAQKGKTASRRGRPAPGEQPAGGGLSETTPQAERSAESTTGPAEQIPEWLGELVGRLDSRRRDMETETLVETHDVSPVETERTEWDAAFDEPFAGYDEERAAAKAARVHRDPGPVTPPPVVPVARRERRASRRFVFRRPAGTQGWRQAIVLTEILGPPVGLRSRRGTGGIGT